MTLTDDLAALPVALPLLCAAIAAALRQWLSQAAANAIAIFGAGINLLLCLVLFTRSLHHTLVYWLGGWYPRGHLAIGIGLVIDPAGAGIAVLACFLMVLGLSFSCRSPVAAANHFQPLMLVLLAAMCGFVLTGDIFNMFVFFELMSTAAFALCGLETGEAAPLQGAFNFAVTNTVAAFFILTGIGMLSAVTGALNLAQMGMALAGRHDALVLFAAALITCGFLVKAAIVPFHFWLPDAHSVAPTAVCVLFSGVMVELGLYAIARIDSVVLWPSFAPHGGTLTAILLGVAVLTVALGGVMCYAQHHLKRLLAFATVTHMALVLAALALHTALGFAGMLIYLLGYALVSAGLFFCTGLLLHRFRTISERRLFAQGRPLRFTATLWFAGAAGLAGAPPFATFAGELLTSHAALSQRLNWLPWIFTLAGMLTGAAVLRTGMHIFFGWGEGSVSDRAGEVDGPAETDSESEKEERAVLWNHFVPAALCLIAAVAVTFIPAVRANILPAATRLIDGSGYIHAVFREAAAPQQAAPFPTGVWLHASLRGALALFLASLLACTSVFRARLPRPLRIGAFLEGPLLTLRSLQSGHPGDYVLWITVGAAGVGLLFTGLLR
jgi:multicomponent Na+:H+ antiporter subunit D